MVKVICGPRGSGKTKKLIDSCNDAVQNAKGNVVYVTDNSEKSYQVKIEIRYINVLEYNISGIAGLTGFIAGLLAGNSDIEYIYLDRARRICDCELEKMESFFKALENYSKLFDVHFVLTATTEPNNIPAFIKKLI